MPVEDSDLNEFADPERILGSLIGDRYLVQRCIGTGGMGVVYLAWQLGLGRHVVLKVIRADRANKSSRLRFRREAYNLSRLAHPSVVSVYDHGADDATGLLYLVMEHVGGLTLQKFQRQLGRLPVAKLVPIASPLLAGLAEIHRNGLIHRDIKAANVMLSSDDGVALQVKIVDFGLSKQLVGDETATLPSEVVGSARSIAPEIFKGETAGPSADVYAAGVLLYELLAGHDRVRTNSPYERMVRSANGDFTPLDQVLPHEHGVPADLIDLVHECLEASPEKRPANGLELASRFERAVKGITPDAFEAAATAERARPMLPIPTMAAVRAAEDGQARASARARSPWGLLSAAFAVAFVSTLVLLAVVLYVLQRPAAPVAEPAAAPVEAPEKAQGLYLEWALAAMQDGDHDLAVSLLTEAIEEGADGAEVVELLQLAMRKQNAVGGRRAPEPVVEAAPVDEVATGKLVVAAYPKGVAFEVPGVAKGLSPSELQGVPVGTHTVRFLDGETVVLEQQVQVSAGEVAVVQVDVAPRPPSEPVPQPVPAAVSREVWVYLPGRPVPDALLTAFQPASVVAFDSYRALSNAVASGSPGVVLAPGVTLRQLGLDATLRGLGRDRQPTAPYVMVTRKSTREGAVYRPKAVIACLDVAGQAGTTNFVRRVMDLPHPPQVRVAEPGTMLGLLKDQDVDALLIPQDLVDAVIGKKRSGIVVKDAPTPGGLFEVAVIDEGRLPGVEIALSGMGGPAADALGVAAWTR